MKDNWYTCHTGRHRWFTAADAEKCCNLKYKRVLVIGRITPDMKNIQYLAGTSAGRQWVEVQDVEA